MERELERFYLLFNNPFSKFILAPLVTLTFTCPFIICSRLCSPFADSCFEIFLFLDDLSTQPTECSGIKAVQKQVTWCHLQGKEIATMSWINKMAEKNMILTGEKK